MNNGTSKEVLAQFDRIARLPEAWDHNRQYQGLLLRDLPRVGRVLDLGCGTGELTRKLAARADWVVGVDLSPEMLRRAAELTREGNVEYRLAEAEAFLRDSPASFDLIVSIAALHHMDEGRILGLMKEALREGGRILVLDLVRDESPADFFVSLIAAILNPFVSLAMRGRIRITKEEREAWAEHAAQDRYLSAAEAKLMAGSVLGGAKVRRRLFWRYSLEYRAPTAEPRAGAAPTGSGLRLRPWSPEDAAGLAAIGDDPEIAANMNDGFPSPFTHERAKDYIARALGGANLLLAVEAEGCLVGSVGAFFSAERPEEAAIAYFIGRAYWNKGYGGAAVRLLVGLLRGRGVRLVVAEPFDRNGASKRLLEKSGFRSVGRLEGAGTKEGRPIDLRRFELELD